MIDEASRIFCIKISSNFDHPKLTACLQVQKNKDLAHQSPVFIPTVCFLRNLCFFFLSHWSDNSSTQLSKCSSTHLPDQVSLFAFQIWYSLFIDLLIWKTSILLKNPLLVPLNNLVFAHGFCSAAWLRGSERVKLANSLEDIYVWVSFIITDFTRRYCGEILATTKDSTVLFTVQYQCKMHISLRYHTHAENIWISTGSMRGRASSTFGWKKLEISLWRNPTAQKQVSHKKWNSCLKHFLL